jgi:hypothetical protein
MSSELQLSVYSYRAAFFWGGRSKMVTMLRLPPLVSSAAIALIDMTSTANNVLVL